MNSQRAVGPNCRVRITISTAALATMKIYPFTNQPR